MIQKSSAHLLALATLTPIVSVKDESAVEAIVIIEVHDKRFVMYEIHKRNFNLGHKYFQYAGSIISSGDSMRYVDEGAQIGHALQFSIVGIDAAGNRSSALLTDIVLVGAT